VIVIGGGNAGLSAALEARLAGASVLVIEAAPPHLRGGNSRHTRNLRSAHDGPSAALEDAYTESEFWDDLVEVTGGATSEPLARAVIRDSAAAVDWLSRAGVRFQPALEGTLQLARTNAFFLGGGKALLNACYRTAASCGVEVVYGADVRELRLRDGVFGSVAVDVGGVTHLIAGGALVAAAGGFEANLEWLKDAWGEAAGNFVVRGTPFDTGRILRMLIDRGAGTVGDPAECHAVAVDARSPRFDGGIVTRVDAIPFGIVVDRNAERFYDEGEDVWPKRYAIWGRLVARRQDQIAFSITDSRAAGLYIPPLFPPIEAPTIAALAGALGLDPPALERTVASFNASVRPGTFRRDGLDDCATSGLRPPKSHWARPLDRAPFFAYPLRPGITFTYFGVTVNERAQVLRQDGTPSPNVFAAGEIMAGNILGRGYLAGLGMTIGTVFGRIAGRESARSARSG
jgi:tricarballylate dehydrogenase